jgi:O-antigen/teichoic acid export membrane protein
MSSIKSRILNGFFWSILNQTCLTVIGLIVTGILSRLISPSEFGILALVSLGIGFLNVIKDFGFGAALIQKKEVSDEEYCTVFWINLIIGVLLTILVYLLAFKISVFFNEPRVELVTKVLSFSFIVNSIGIVWNNRLIKAIAFNQIFYRTLISTILSGLVAVILAWNGYGLWALISQSYISLITNTYLNYLHVKWLPRLVVKKEYISSLFSFGLPLLADQSINYWVRNIDNLLVGKYLGKDVLAYYSKAYSLMLLPVRQLTGTLTKVLFPSFSLIQDDTLQIARIYLKISRVIALVAFPVMICMSALAEPIILIVYGDQWKPVIPIFRVLSILGMFQALGSLSGNIYLALGKTKLMFRLGLFSRSLMIIGIVVGLFNWGLMGMVFGYCIASGLGFIPELYLIGKLININLKTIVVNFLPYLAFAFVCFLAVNFLSSIMPESYYIKFIVKLLTYGTLYCVLNIMFKPPAYRDLIGMIRKNNSQ